MLSPQPVTGPVRYPVHAHFNISGPTRGLSRRQIVDEAPNLFPIVRLKRHDSEPWSGVASEGRFNEWGKTASLADFPIRDSATTSPSRTPKIADLPDVHNIEENMNVSGRKNSYTDFVAVNKNHSLSLLYVQAESVLRKEAKGLFNVLGARNSFIRQCFHPLKGAGLRNIVDALERVHAARMVFRNCQNQLRKIGIEKTAIPSGDAGEKAMCDVLSGMSERRLEALLKSRDIWRLQALSGQGISFSLVRPGPSAGGGRAGDDPAFFNTVGLVLRAMEACRREKFPKLQTKSQVGKNADWGSEKTGEKRFLHFWAHIRELEKDVFSFAGIVRRLQDFSGSLFCGVRVVEKVEVTGEQVDALRKMQRGMLERHGENDGDVVGQFRLDIRRTRKVTVNGDCIVDKARGVDPDQAAEKFVGHIQDKEMSLAVSSVLHQGVLAELVIKSAQEHFGCTFGVNGQSTEFNIKRSEKIDGAWQVSGFWTCDVNAMILENGSAYVVPDDRDVKFSARFSFLVVGTDEIVPAHPTLFSLETNTGCPDIRTWQS